MSLLAQLDPFSAKDGSLPQSSRMDLSMEQRVGRPFLLGWGVGDVCKLGWIVANKANHLATELISHKLYGPRRPSWGVEMTIITSFLRDAGKHSSLADIAFIRAITSLSTYLPPALQTQITPLSFRVRSRGLRGLLATFDSFERGGPNYDDAGEEGGFGEGRWLGGEWVVDKALWRGWQKEWRAASPAPAGCTTPSGAPRERRRSAERKTSVDRLRAGSPSPARPSSAASGHRPSSSLLLTPPATPTPPGVPPPAQQRPRVILYLHGGAYYAFSASTHRSITSQLSLSTASRVFALNYRLSPETRFPGPLHDAVSAYLRLYEEEGVGEDGGPELLLAGDSAGGGLCLGLLMYLRDNDYPLPGGAILMSPWVDLTMSCDSWDSNAPYDIVPIPEPGDHLNPVLCYLGPEGAKKYLTHPYASPLFGDFHGLPPLLIQSGEAEVLRDEITLLAYKATTHGVRVMHEVYSDMVHVFPSMPFLAATRVAFNSQRDFVLRVLPAWAAADCEAAALEHVVSSASTTPAAAAAGADDDGAAAVAPAPLERTNTASTIDSDMLVTPSSDSDDGSRAIPAVPPIPPQFRRAKSSSGAPPLAASSLAASSPPPATVRPSPKSYRSHQPPSALLSLLHQSSAASSSPAAAGSPTPKLHGSSVVVPPTPPKGRSRSLSHPDVAALILGFEEGAHGGKGYTVQRFAVDVGRDPATAATTTNDTGAVRA